MQTLPNKCPICDGEIIVTRLQCQDSEDEIGLSYPTIRNRLHEIIRAMGYEPGGEEPGMSDDERRQILEDLEQGKITYEDAIGMLKEGEEGSDG